MNGCNVPEAEFTRKSESLSNVPIQLPSNLTSTMISSTKMLISCGYLLK